MPICDIEIFEGGFLGMDSAQILPSKPVGKKWTVRGIMVSERRTNKDTVCAHCGEGEEKHSQCFKS